MHKDAGGMRVRCIFTKVLSETTEKGQEYDATASCKTRVGAKDISPDAAILAVLSELDDSTGSC